jgi:phosphonate transport system substrate-binding protein
MILLTASSLLADCSIPTIRVTIETTQTASPTISAETAEPPTETPLPTQSSAQLGLAENPLILALPPTANSPEQIDSVKQIAAQITERTGYTVVTVAPDSYTALLDALGQHNAHIVLLDPYSYTLAYQKDLVQASYAIVKNGKGKYGAQFMTRRDTGFKSYFNPVINENLISDPNVALGQLANKKPCWSDEISPSGYVVPLGYLNQHQIITKPAAFVGGHPTVVRSLYASGICDFGASYVDARKFPSLEDEFPDLMEKVIILWRIPDIIPYDVLAFSTNVPPEMRSQIASIIPAILQTEAGKIAFKTAYDIENLEAVNDAYYDDFRAYVQESGVDLSSLVK